MEWTNSAQSDYTNWGWEYNPDYIDRFYTQIRYRGLWFNGQSNWNSQYIVEFSSAISDADAQAVVSFSGAGTTGGDYTTSIGAPDANRTVTISAGQSSANIVITGVDEAEGSEVDEPTETILVADSLTGQIAVNVAKEFDANRIIEFIPSLKERIVFTSGRIGEIDAVIATGSDNSMQYFEQYFGKYPNIFRKNRTSIAVLMLIIRLLSLKL